MELLVRVVDKTNSDPKLDRALTKRGDVIAVSADGHVWGTQEVSNPDWVILKLPDMTREQAESLLAPEHPPDLNNRYVLRKRSQRINLNALKLNATLTAAELLSKVVMKGGPPLRADDVIGPTDDTVIGP